MANTCQPGRDMSLRKIASVTMLVSLLVLVINSIVLYVVPEGRVAYWADWRFWGLSKTEWGDQHVTVGVLFLAAGILHIYFNWRPILSYLKDKAREIRIFTGPFNIALALTAIFVVGTYLQMPPFCSIVGFSAHFKDAAAKRYGEPPYGHAELSSLKHLAKREGLDLERSLGLLKSAGFGAVDQNETIRAIAERNRKTPQQVYAIIGGASAGQASSGTGRGKRPLAEVSARYGLSPEELIRRLATRGIRADAGATIREIAIANGRSPAELIEEIQALATGPGK